MNADGRARTVAILQARLSSSRLPGKVLLPLGGKPLIAFMIERVRRAGSIDELVLATSRQASDDPLADAVEALGVRVVRGPLEDVLARFALAAELTSPDVIVRLTGDCPLIDPVLIDRVVDQVVSGAAAYASNCLPPTYPDGLDCEAFTAELLRAAHHEARLASEREHVTPWIRDACAGRMAAVRSTFDLSNLRWTIDYPDDLVHVRAMVDLLGEKAVHADLFDLLRAHEALKLGNNVRSRNEGYAKSLATDAKGV